MQHMQVDLLQLSGLVDKRSVSASVHTMESMLQAVISMRYNNTLSC